MAKHRRVQVDLTNGRVDIEPTESDAAELCDAIQEADYMPVLITAPDVVASGSTPPKSGGCG